MGSPENALVRSSYFTNIQTGIDRLGRKNRNILVYYGEPTLTSQLSRALHSLLCERGQLCAFVDGVGLKENTASPVEKGPALLRAALRGEIDFSCYDIAHWCYWAAVNPELAIDSVEFSKKMSRTDKISAFADLVGAGQGLDFSGVLKQMNLAEMSGTARALIPEMMNDVAKLVEEAIPFGVFAAKLAWFFVGLEERRRIWWKERGNEDLRELRTECGRPFDVLPRIPLFLARDLKQHFRRTDLSDGQTTAVVLVDGYDHLADGKQQVGQCSWLEAMLSQTESSPHILWVITAERPLVWMADAQQVAVVPTTGWESSLCVDAIQDSWSDEKRKLFELMAIPRYWDESLFRCLAERFLLYESNTEGLTEENLQEKLSVLTESLYVLSLGDGTWRWRREMREYLLMSQSLPTRQQVHNWLFEYYQALAANTSQEISALKEALYHGLELPQPEATINWFLAAVLPAIEQRPHPAIAEIVSDLIDASDLLSLEQIALTYTRLGQALAALYEWSEAERILETALQHWRTLEENCLEAQKNRSGAEENRSEARENQLAVAQTWTSLAEVYLELENSFDSLKSAQMAARIWDELLGEDSLPYAQALSQQGSAYFSQGRRLDARRVSEQAVEIASALPDVTLLQLGELKWTAANVCCHADSLDEARRRCLDLVQFTAQLPDTEEHDLSIRSIALLGDIYSHMGKRKWQQAFDCYQQTIEQSQSTWGPDNDYAVAAIDAQIRLGRQLGQKDMVEKLEGLRENIVQPDQFENASVVAASNNRRAFALCEKGQYGKAEPLYLRAISLYERALGRDNIEMANCLHNLATLYDHQGRYEEAESFYLEAANLLREIPGDNRSYRANSLDNLSTMYVDQKRYEEAENLCRQALSLRQQALGSDDPAVANSLHNLGSLYLDQGRYEEAEPLLKRAVSLNQRTLGKDHHNVLKSLDSLGSLYTSQLRYEEAEPILQQNLILRQRTLGNEHPDIAHSLHTIAILYGNLERHGEAEGFFQRALAMSQRLVGDDHPHTQAIAQNLKNLQNKVGHQ